MKKILCYLFTSAILLSASPVFANNTSLKNQAERKTEERVKAEVLISRLDEIKAMNLSALNPAEKKGLRKEVKDIKNELKAIGDGLYLSMGALVIILILLIILV